MAVTEWWKNTSCGGRRSAFMVFFLVLLLHCIAILLFTSGFLLTRTELPHHSQCSDVSQSPCGLPDRSPQGDHDGVTCWTKPAVDRLVIIVLDALRFDFVAPSTFFEEKKPWMDKLQVLHKFASESESAARIFKAIADPPTTSLQRLKGLTTGGLPTFIDIGNSFGAPAIVEDNLIHQLVQNGKRVVMMGDDTWTQLFPHHFNKSYPYPSFNVKDLDTVDNGCISHLIPTLYDDDWDVLIAHFLGVDHAGHIFGVDSVQMIEKLQQYNEQLEKVVEVLQSQAGRGSLHENTLLLVMGDHGQTINGDHGGGSAEEVDTSIFAMSLRKPSITVPPEFDASSLHLQLDFAATVSALLGIPFPYGSIGRVNPMLYALVAGTWNLEDYDMSSSQSQLKLEEWMHNYAKVLCINSWQVKKYIDVYTASSVIGFSVDDLKHVADMYAQAVNWSDSLHDVASCKDEACRTSFDALKKQIDLYSNFLASVAELARTKFTEFNLRMMGIGFGILLISIFIHVLVIKRVDDITVFPSRETSSVSFGLIVSCTIVTARACSFLSNSYILEEGKMTNFLLASIGMLGLRHSIMTKKMIFEATAFVFLISILRFTIELGLSKPQEVLDFHSWMYVADLMPIVPLIILACLLYKSIACSSCNRLLKFVITGSIFSYILLALHWTLESNLSSMTPLIFDGIKGNFIPRAIYIMGIAQLLSLAVLQFFEEVEISKWGEMAVMKAVAILSVWSSTLMILSGKQGPWIALASVVGGWLISRLKGLEQDNKNATTGLLALYSSPVTQWSLLASCLFFCSGHWFDEFTIIPQAILLTIETYGFSHILPTLGLPILVAYKYSSNEAKQTRQSLIQLFQVYLIYGLIMAVTTTFTVLCVIIQKRHLMVWGLFAPKFVFDVVGLILTDALICVSSVFYFIQT
ncbi:Alkaline phosphatase-like, alpha/beta/alpha [Cynara cardunculus var. scolymus]|uniref:Alkaline phosphatase-like, alpha/beta/alpha n=1 Tax=Cynara cardunculus var. scolymus TaxID=59895 RepID=A0A118K2G4_CYNCS|nr:Alkaline phosphatase-like, alpha/beta/alpha [Cynara cardunculus var. scolymus]